MTHGLTRTAMTALLGLLIGCISTDKPAASSKEEKQVQEVFTAFQQALKAKDLGKLWALLDADSQADANRAAKSVREAYAKASAAEKAEQEKALGLKGEELA